MTAPAPTAPLMAGSAAPMNIDVSNGLYVHITYETCALCKIIAECYTGNTENHPAQPFAKVTIPHILCNFCRMCDCACLIDTVCPITDGAGTQIGEMKLGKDCSCLCCTPRLSVTLGGKVLGRVHNKCMRCNFEAFEGEGKEAPIAYTSKCCNMNKWLSCLIGGCWECYRSLFTNKTTTENYLVKDEAGAAAFDIVSVRIGYRDS